MSTVVGRYGSPDPHGFACAASESTGEYFAARSCAADSAPRAQAGTARTTRSASKATIKRWDREPLTCSRILVFGPLPVRDEPSRRQGRRSTYPSYRICRSSEYPLYSARLADGMSSWLTRLPRGAPFAARCRPLSCARPSAPVTDPEQSRRKATAILCCRLDPGLQISANLVWLRDEHLRPPRGESVALR